MTGTAPPRLLSQIRGLRVLTTDGQPAGRLNDLTVRLGPAHPLVDRLLVRRGRIAFLVDWDDVAEVATSHVSLKRGARLQRTATSSPGLRHDEILLVRDVLDTQVVNLSGHGLARVADVLILDRGDGLAGPEQDAALAEEITGKEQADIAVTEPDEVVGNPAVVWLGLVVFW